MLEYPAERLNRGIAIIRKNCLFAGSEAGGQRLAILYSFAATCKANRIWFRKWLKNIMPRLNSTPAGQIDSLIPEAKLSMSSCSNLFKTLSPIFSFTMRLAGRLQLSVSKCAQNFGHYHAAGQNKRTFKLKLLWSAVCLLVCLSPFLDKTWRLCRGFAGCRSISWGEQLFTRPRCPFSTMSNHLIQS